MCVGSNVPSWMGESVLFFFHPNISIVVAIINYATTFGM